jgi:type I restriction enzyme S subunit
MSWPEVMLGSLTQIRTGKLDANASSSDGEYPFFTCAIKPLRIATYSYDTECVLVAGNGDLNVKYYDGKFDAYQRTYIIESTDKSRLNVRYLYHFMERYVSKLREMAIGGVIKYIKLGYLTDAQVPLPSLPEQKRIAAILDKADAIRRKRQEAIRLTEELLRSAFLEMFGDPVTNPKGWEVKKLGDLIRVKSGEGLSAKSMDPGGVFAVYGGNGISGRHSKYMFDVPKIVIGRVGVYCGSIHRTEPQSWVTDNALFVAETDVRLQDDYLEWALRMADFNQYADRAAQPLISGGRIYPVEIAVPTSHAQRRFSAVLKQHQRLCQTATLATTTSSTLAEALTQQAFAGKL